MHAGTASLWHDGICNASMQDTAASMGLFVLHLRPRLARSVAKFINVNLLYTQRHIIGFSNWVSPGLGGNFVGTLTMVCWLFRQVTIQLQQAYLETPPRGAQVVKKRCSNLASFGSSSLLRSYATVCKRSQRARAT